MKKIFSIILLLTTLTTLAQKTTPIYGDTVSITKNLVVKEKTFIKDTAITNHAGDALITDAQGKIKTIPFSIASSQNTIYTSDDTIKENRFVAGVDTNSLIFYDFDAVQAFAKDVFMGTWKYHFFANVNAVGNEVYDTILGTPCRLVMVTDQTHHLTQNGTFYDGVSKYSLLQTTKDLVYMMTTNGIDSTNIALYPDKIKIYGLEDTSAPILLYGKDINGNMNEFNYIQKTIYTPSNGDTISINAFRTSIISPPTSISNIIIELPITTQDGAYCKIKFADDIADIELLGNGATIKGWQQHGSKNNGTTLELFYNSSNNTWY